MASVLVAWINDRDLEASGPSGMVESRILKVVADEFYAQVYLLSASKKAGRSFKKWLGALVTTPVEFERVKVNNPLDYAEVWETTLQALADCKQRLDEDEIEWSFLLGADSAVMDAVMIHAANTELSAELLQWSKADGLQVIDVARDRFPLAQNAESAPPVTAFQAAANLDVIEHHSPQMDAVHAHAQRLAALDVPVLLTGESGTGREMLARAIHKGSKRRGPFVAMDCEALEPDEQAEALFGAGGLIAQAKGGTLLLDALDHLAPSVQALLHRAIRDGRAASVREPLDVRIMATATGHPGTLLSEGRVREDLFHAIAIGMIHVPPLRDRPADVGPFIDRVLQRINDEMGPRELSPEARELVANRPWLGNHRELEATLRRAAVLAEKVIEQHHIQQCVFEGPSWELPPDFDVQAALDDVARGYLRRAMQLHDGNKTQAAKALGLNNYQTLTNWMRRLGVEGPVD
ncbi:MAG: sigma 54-interacting transcriptional regulator [bacterium]